MFKTNDLRDQTVEELEANLNETRKELYELTNEMKLNKKLEKPHLLGEKRRDVAKLKTIIKEKQKQSVRG